MDSYPGDLLAGVFPLVFAVDAIAPASQEATAEAPGNESPSPAARNLFDRFMDALAASLVDDDVNDEVSTAARSKSGSETLTSFLRGDNDESSDEDDISFMDASSRKGGRRNSPFLHMRRHQQSHAQGPSNNYANYHANEGFFQRARILSISTRHGFPPSKDPEGTNNRALLLSQARSTLSLATTAMNTARLKSILEEQPIDGILPAGWLEKHVHALPSALLVLTSLSSEEEHDEASDKRLLETIDHLQESLAPKRECHIHVVCLIEDMASVSQSRIDGWFDQLRAHSSIGSSDISLLSLDDLLPSSTSSPALRGLHKTVRDASLAYYLRQARRAKRKHSVLGHERQPNLLPLAARYCFKIGVFYEFQLKITKSLRYFAAAYRHVETYYRYLQGIAPEQPFLEGDVVVNPQGDETVEMALPEESLETTDEDEQTGAAGVEVALSNEEEEELEEDTPPLMDETKKVAPTDEIPDDMAHQCRAIADWLNFKLLQAGFLSSAYTESPEGILAASAQWRRHVQSFLTRDKTNPSWNHWLYVTQQRLVMSQLVERHKPRSAEGLDKEVLVRCSPWRNYQAVAEAVLCLGTDLKKQKAKNSAWSVTSGSDQSQGASLRKRYVGGLDSEGLAPTFEKESKKNHTAGSLELILRAIALYENELESKEQNDEDNKTLVRTGARLYYVAGGILLGVQKYKEAIPHLQKAVRFAAGWDGLESITRRMLVNCYEKHTPQGSDTLGSDESSFVLNVVYNAGVSSATVSSLIGKYAASCGGETPLKWYHSCTDESQSSMPISFTVTFPGATHATAGDTTVAYVTVKSNLNYPISVNSMTLLSSAEHIEVPSADLVAAEDTFEGGDGSIVIKPNAIVRLTTKINLPRDVEKIAVDESMSPEKQATPGTGASVKSARPRTAGISSAAGARLVSEKVYGSGPSAQWSLSCLGGRALRCDGMRLSFTPVDTTGVSIDLTVEKKNVPVPPFAKRTPFEHDNYVALAWSRPLYLPLSSGPRCLRVLGPLPKMVVTDLTNPVVDGRALEGTVNRILLKLKAGENEVCRDVKYSVSCSSTVLSSKDGTTRSLTQPEGPSSPGGSGLDVSNMRTPVIVARTIGTGSQSTGFGFTLPKGWHIVGTGQRTKDDETLEAVSMLSSGDESYIELDLYRPSRGAVEEDDGICQTDFEVSISYRQTRMVEGAESEVDESDLVSLVHSGSVLWTSPITAAFALSGVEKAFPSGSRHPMNICPPESEKPMKTPVSPRDEGDSEIALIDGERVSAKCVVRANDSLGVHVTQLKFENWEDPSDYEEEACSFRHVSDENEDGVLYTSTGANLTGQLTKGSQLGVAYTLEANMSSEYKKGSVTTALGAVSVHWGPLPTLLNEGAQEHAHGPLVLEEPSVMTFRGPSCYVESAPFETVLQAPPTPPRVATPFEMCYRISNKTGVHQKLSVRMTSSDSEGNNQAEEGILVSGLVQGEIRLAPYESQILSYTALAMHAGKTMLPALTIASDRYKTWIMNGNDAAGASRQLYVLP